MKDLLERLAIDRLTRGDAKVPRNWDSIKIYELLVSKGLAREVAQPNILIRQFTAMEST